MFKRSLLSLQYAPFTFSTLFRHLFVCHPYVMLLFVFLFVYCHLHTLSTYKYTLFLRINWHTCSCTLSCSFLATSCQLSHSTNYCLFITLFIMYSLCSLVALYASNHKHYHHNLSTMLVYYYFAMSSGISMVIMVLTTVLKIVDTKQELKCRSCISSMLFIQSQLLLHCMMPLINILIFHK